MVAVSPSAKKIVAACVFWASLVGAAVGVWQLEVLDVVLRLVVATLSGFYLLKLRADERGGLDRSSP